MSYQDAAEPRCQTSGGRVEVIIEPKAKDLGEFSVRRVLPAREKRSVGPFVFFDEMGPAIFPPGKGIQVRPHPHIGLATVTYLFDGEIMHRDSLGYVQAIRPGAVNLMTAGRGIVHSERAGADLDEEARLHGIQTWLALPEELQETDPAFAHYPASTIPEVVIDDVEVRVVIGEAFGVASPVAMPSQTIYLELKMPPAGEILIPACEGELGAYVVSGSAVFSGERLLGAQMAVFSQGSEVKICAEDNAHLIVVGGRPLGRRHLWWNFVSTSGDRIDQAKADWRAGGFDLVPGDDEFIPLPT